MKRYWPLLGVALLICGIFTIIYGSLEIIPRHHFKGTDVLPIEQANQLQLKYGANNVYIDQDKIMQQVCDYSRPFSDPSNLSSDKPCKMADFRRTEYNFSTTQTSDLTNNLHEIDKRLYYTIITSMVSFLLVFIGVCLIVRNRAVRSRVKYGASFIASITVKSFHALRNWAKIPQK